MPRTRRRFVGCANATTCPRWSPTRPRAWCRTRTPVLPACSATPRSSVRLSSRAICSSASASIRSNCSPARGRSRNRSHSLTGGGCRRPRAVCDAVDHRRHRRGDRDARRESARIGMEPRRRGADMAAAAPADRHSRRRAGCPAGGGRCGPRVGSHQPGDGGCRRAHVSRNPGMAGARTERPADFERTVDDGIRAAGRDRRGAD